MIPSKRSQNARPGGEAGSANSVRYHQDERNGLSPGMGRLEKFFPIGYVAPGSERRAMPK